MTVTVAGVVSAGLLGAVVAGAGWYRAKRVADARELGFALFEEGRYAEALQPLSYFASRNRSDVEALVRLGIARAAVFVENNRHLVSAAAFLEAALKLRPGDPEALRALVPVYRQLGYRTELLRVADQLLAVDSRDVGAREARLETRVAQGDWRAAIEDAEILVEVQPEEVRWRGILLDLLRFAERPIEQRLALVDLWIAGGEPDGRYRLLRAEQLMLDGKPELASAECALAADRGISELASLERLVELMQLMGLQDNLDRTLEISRQRFGASLVGRLQARLNLLAGRHQEAMGDLDEVWNAGERSTEVGFLRVVAAELAADAARSDLAMQELEATSANGTVARAKIEAWTRAVRASRAVLGSGSREGKRPTASERREAREATIRAFQSWPNDSFLFFRHGEMAIASGEYPAARQLLQAAFQLEGRRWALAGVRAAHAALRSGLTDDAFGISREVVARHPRNPLAYIGFAEAISALSREGRVPSMVDPTLPRGLSASGILQQVYEASDRDQSVLVPLVVALIDEGQSEEAIDVALEAAGREKPDVERICQVVEPLLESGEIESVEEILRLLRRIDPDSFEIRIAAVDLLVARAELNRAAEESAAIVEGLPEGDSRLSVALRQSARIATLRSDPQANRHLARYLQVSEGDPEAASFVLGQSVTWNDESLVQQAIALLRETGGEGSQQVILADASRILAFHRGDPKALAEATMSVNQLLRENPNLNPALIVLARLLSASIPPDWSRASGFLAKAVDQQPRDTFLYPELVILLQKAGNTVDATRYLQQYLRMTLDDEEASRRGARLLLNQGAFVEAIPALERLSGQTGGESDLLAFAEANRAAGRVTAAEAAYREAANRSGRSPLAVQAYAEFLARLGRVEEGREVIRKDAAGPAPVLSEADRMIFLLRLESIYGTTESMGEVNRLISDMADSDPRVVAVLAQQALRRGEAPEALRITREGLARFPEDEALLGMTASLLIADRALRDQSGDILDRLGRTRPDWRDLLEVIRLGGGDGDEFKLSDETLKRALDLTENHPLFPEGWSFAASLQQEAGRTDEAIRIARRAVSRLPSDAGIAAMAAGLLADAGRTEEAKEAAMSWRRLVPENTVEADTLLASLTVASNPSAALALLEPHLRMIRSDPLRHVTPTRILILAHLSVGNVEAAADIALANAAVGPILAAWTSGARSFPPSETKAMLDRVPRDRLSPEGRLGIAAEYAAVAARGATGAAEVSREILGGLPPDLSAGPAARLLRADLLAAVGQGSQARQAYEDFIGGIAAPRLASFENSAPGTLGAEEEQVRLHYLYALNNAAALEALEGGDASRGLRIVDRALKSGKDLVFLLDTQVQLLLASGDVTGARAAAARATSIDRNSLEAWLAVAEAELAAGRAESVERALREITRIWADSIIVERQAFERRQKVESGLEAIRAVREAA